MRDNGYHPDQHGAVLVFRPDLTKEEITKGLEAIRHLLDGGYNVDPSLEGLVREFDSRWGGPVWYVP